jgi:tRNA-guanine family transglycosylase
MWKKVTFVPIISGGDLPEGNIRAGVLWFWKKMIYDQVMISYPYAIRAYPNPCDLRKKMGLTRNITLWIDSGGYQIFTRKLSEKEISVEKVLRYQEFSDCDIAFTLDVPNDLERTYSNAIKALELKKREDMRLYATLQHVFDYSSAALMTKKLDKYSFDGIAIGKLIPKKFNLIKRVEIILGVIRNTKKPVHCLGFSGVEAPYLAALLGISSFDSMTYLHAAINRQYIVPFFSGQIFNVGKIDLKKAWKRYKLKEEPPCFCPICSRIDNLDYFSQKGSIPGAMLALHNLFTMLSEVRLINNALSEGWVEELINLRCKVSPSLRKAVEFIQNHIR